MQDDGVRARRLVEESKGKGRETPIVRERQRKRALTSFSLTSNANGKESRRGVEQNTHLKGKLKILPSKWDVDCVRLKMKLNVGVHAVSEVRVSAI